MGGDSHRHVIELRSTGQTGRLHAITPKPGAMGTPASAPTWIFSMLSQAFNPKDAKKGR